jgi:hypothetical protein
MNTRFYVRTFCLLFGCLVFYTILYEWVPVELIRLYLIGSFLSTIGFCIAAWRSEHPEGWDKQIYRAQASLILLATPLLTLFVAGILLVLCNELRIPEQRVLDWEWLFHVAFGLAVLVMIRMFYYSRARSIPASAWA